MFRHALPASPTETAVRQKTDKDGENSEASLQLFLVTGAISKAAEISACFR